jgi:hypothetical protein
MYSSLIFVSCFALIIFLLFILVILLKIEYRQYKIDKDMKKILEDCFDKEDNVLLYTKDGRVKK